MNTSQLMLPEKEASYCKAQKMHYEIQIDEHVILEELCETARLAHASLHRVKFKNRGYIVEIQTAQSTTKPSGPSRLLSHSKFACLWRIDAASVFSAVMAGRRGG